MVSAPLRDTVSFSILNRIGGDATRSPPQSWPRGGTLSVSSIGSEAMQLLFALVVAAGVPAFSILNRIGGDATNGNQEEQEDYNDLSVSSIGSEAMQRRR